MNRGRAGDKDSSAPSLPSQDREVSWIRRMIAVIGIVMVPVVVVGVLVAVTLGASYFVAGPLVLLVGGLLAKIVPYYFQSDT